MPVQKPYKRLSRLESRVLKTIREHAMIAPGNLVIVGVSGGADSTALLLVLKSLAPLLGCRLVVAHLNHCLRGPEGDGDAAFVRRMSDDFGLPCVIEIVDVRARASEEKQNLEQAARDIRYAFLRRVARQEAAQKIAVGHNQNDQMETTLFRFLRGSGVEGLSAIHPVVDGQVIRPLIESTRQSILEYLQKKGQEYREDSSNEDLRYSRNRIRRELVPYLETHFNPRLVRTISRESSLMRETWDLLESQAKELFEGMFRPLEEGISLPIPAIKGLHPVLQREVLRYALRHCRGNLREITREHIEAILAVCLRSQSGVRVMLPQNFVAIRQFDELLLLRRAFWNTGGFRYELKVPGRCYVTEAGAEFRADILEGKHAIPEENYSVRACFALSSLRMPLIVRSRQNGDRYGGPVHRKVKKMLIDRKIPLVQRSFLPMVVSGRNVIWIPGFKPAKGYGTRDVSKPFVTIEYSRDTIK